MTGLVSQARSIYNLHRKGGPAGECRSPLRCLSQFLSHERERDQLLMVFFYFIPLFDGIAQYLSWVIAMTFIVRRRYDIFPIG